MTGKLLLNITFISVLCRVRMDMDCMLVVFTCAFMGNDLLWVDNLAQ